jgi:hypothetical protein
VTAGRPAPVQFATLDANLTDELAAPMRKRTFRNQDCSTLDWGDQDRDRFSLRLLNGVVGMVEAKLSLRVDKAFVHSRAISGRGIPGREYSSLSWRVAWTRDVA